MWRHMLLEGLLDAGKEDVYGLLTLSVGHLSGDTQKTNYGVSVIIILQGLSPDSLLYRVSCVALFSGLHDSCHIFLGRPSHVFMTRETNGGVNCTVPLSLFADPERILRRLYVFAEEPCKSTTAAGEPCSPVFKEVQPRPSEHSNLEYHIKQLESVSVCIWTVHYLLL